MSLTRVKTLGFCHFRKGVQPGMVGGVMSVRSISTDSKYKFYDLVLKGGKNTLYGNHTSLSSPSIAGAISNTSPDIPVTSIITTSTDLSTSGNSSHIVDSEIPTEPGSEDCCMSGCAICVWDLYNQKLQAYREKMGIESAEAGDPSMQAFLDLEKSLMDSKV